MYNVYKVTNMVVHPNQIETRVRLLNWIVALLDIELVEVKNSGSNQERPALPILHATSTSL